MDDCLLKSFYDGVKAGSPSLDLESARRIDNILWNDVV